MLLKNLALGSIFTLTNHVNGQSQDYNYDYYNGGYEFPFGPALRGLADTHGTKHLLQMIRSEICKTYHSDKSLRKCPAKATHIEAALRNYGCNCWPENFDDVPAKKNGVTESWHMGKNGKPINDLDAACTKLRDSFTCITYDYMDGLLDDPNPISQHMQDGCNRFTIFDFYFDDDSNIICGKEDDIEYANDLPANRCKKASCEIQRQFAIEAAILLGASPSNFPSTNAADYNINRDSVRCPKADSAGSVSASQCCGDFPNRLPFNPMFKECCGSEAKDVGDCS